MKSICKQFKRLSRLCTLSGNKEMQRNKNHFPKEKAGGKHFNFLKEKASGRRQVKDSVDSHEGPGHGPRISP